LSLEGQQQTKIDYQTYVSERAAMLDAAREQTKFTDQAVLTLSGGALGLSLTFLDKITPASGATHLGWLFWSWATLAGSIVIVFAGVHLSDRAINRYIDALDDNQRTGADANRRNPWAGLTSMLNHLASALLIAGIVCLCAFVYLNFPRAQTEKQGVPAVTPQTPVYVPPRTPDGGIVPRQAPVPAQPAPVSPHPATPTPNPGKKD
jgi:hypothetical protein